MGQTEEGRYLTVYFVRKLTGEALIVSARDMSKKERSPMGRSKKKRDPIPEHFKTLDAAAKFWDTHDLADASSFRSLAAHLNLISM